MPTADIHSQVRLLAPIHARPVRIVLSTAATLLALTGRAAAAGDPPPPPSPLRESEAAGRLWDEAGLLGHGREAAHLRDRLDTAARRAGLPIAVALVASGAAAASPDDTEGLANAARDLVAERALSDGGADAVLLMVALHPARAVLETGKGEAGIVPEIDARPILADLRRALGGAPSPSLRARALGEAADRLATSALATRERRRPLEREDPVDDRAAQAASSATTTTAATGVGPDALPADAAGARPHRSLLPAAYGLAAFVLLGLALRQRRRGQSPPKSEIRRR